MPTSSSAEALSEGDSCSISTSESYSCRRVVDESGRAFKECIRKRERLRHCLGRAPETLESYADTTREELPQATLHDSEQWSTHSHSWSGGFSWDGQGDAAGAPTPPWGLGPGGRSSPAGKLQEFLGQWVPRGVPLPAWGLEGGRGRDGLHLENRKGDRSGGVAEKGLSELFEEMLRSGEASARAAMQQLGQELEDFQPFKGLHSIFGDPHQRQAGGAQRDPQTGSEESGGGGASVSNLPWFVPKKVPKKSVYDELGRDFDEV